MFLSRLSRLRSDVLFQLLEVHMKLVSPYKAYSSYCFQQSFDILYIISYLYKITIDLVSIRNLNFRDK